MKCKYFTVRSRKYIKFLYCRNLKKEITYNDCKNCLKFESNQKCNIKNKSNKLIKAEKKRFSILTNNLKVCFECGRPKKHIHEIYKGANRQASIKYGFCIPICEECHSRTEIDIDFLRKFQILCQKEYEKMHSKEEFMRIIGRSYL